MEEKEIKKENVDIMGMFIYVKGASFKSEVSSLLKKHVSVKTVSNVMTYQKGKEVITKFGVNDVQFVETFITFASRIQDLTFCLFVNGKQVNMALLK